MDNSKTYCINCDEKVPYGLTARNVIMTAHGITFTYMEYVAYCLQCGDEIYVPDINDINARAREQAWYLEKLRRGIELESL